MSPVDEKVEEKVDAPVDAPGGDDDMEGMPDMSALQGMLGGGEGGEGGAGGMDMNALMAMMGKGGGGGAGGGMDMASMMAGMGGKGGGKGGGYGGGGGGGGGGQPPPKDDAEKADAGGKWHWQQKGEEIQVRFPQEIPITKKEIVVKFKRMALSVTIKGEVVLDGALAGGVDVDECTWCIAPGGKELQVMLTKQDGTGADWPCFIK